MSARVAAVIPLYNHAAYIGRAIESLLGQTRPPDRIVIVDDGSTDASVEAVRAFDDPRILLETGPNRGAHLALRRGIELAEGADVIAILNSDDWFLPGRLARCVPHLEEHPSISLVCTRLQLVDSAGGDLPESEPRSKWFAAAWSLAGGDLSLSEHLGIANFAGTTSNFVARREWLLRNPFGPYRYVHDYEALILAAVRDELAVIDEPLVAYRVHPGNTITTEPSRLIRELLRLNLELARRLADEVEADPAVRGRWMEYLRCSWGNISAFRADLYQVLLARALAAHPAEFARKLVDSLDAERYAELREFPNRALVNAHGGAGPLGPTSGLAEKHQALLADHRRLRTEQRQWKCLARLQAEASRSRWLALGGLLGAGRGVFRSAAPDPGDRLREIREGFDRSGWIRAGLSLKSRSLQKIQSILESTDA